MTIRNHHHKKQHRRRLRRVARSTQTIFAGQRSADCVAGARFAL